MTSTSQVYEVDDVPVLVSVTYNNHLVLAVTSQDKQRPETPDKLKKFRQSRLHEPGAIFRHYSAYNDPVDTQKVYGRVRGPRSCLFYPTPALMEDTIHTQ